MTKRIRKIGIAARLTAVVAVILAVFVVPWVGRQSLRRIKLERKLMPA